MNQTDTKQSWLQLTAVQAGGVICLPIFLIGHALATNYGIASAIIAIILGNLLLLVMGSVAAWSVSYSRKSTAEISVDLFGVAGRYLFATAMVVSMMGWFAIQLNLMTLGIQEVFPKVPAGLCNVSLGVAVTYAGIKGMRGLEKIVNWSMPLLLITIFYALFLGEPATVQAVDGEVVTFQGISLVLAAAIAAVVDLPTFFRLSRSQKDGLAASLLLFGLIIPLLEGVGVYLFANKAEDNFVRVLASPASPMLWKAWVFAFIVFAGWTTNQANLYSASVSMGTIVPEMRNQTRVLLLGAFGSLISCLNLLDHLVGVLDLIGILLGSMGAVMVVHCLLNGKTEKRFNFAAWLIGLLAGASSQQGYDLMGIPVVDAFVFGLIGMGVAVVKNMFKNKEQVHEYTVSN